MPLILAAAAAASCTKEETGPEFNPETGGYRVELKARMDRPATKITEAEDETDGLKTSWSTGERIDALFFVDGSPVKAVLTSPEGNGRFAGEVASESEAEAFVTEDLYCINVSDKIETVLEGSGMVATVDFSGQDGSVGNVAKYELMYAKGKSKGETLRFAHQSSVLRLTFKGLSGSTLTSATYSFAPSPGSASDALFADRVIYTVGPGGISSEISDITFYEMSGMDIAVEDGCATVYLVVPARGQLKGELSVIVTTVDNGTEASKSFRSYITLGDEEHGGKSFGASKVVARDVHPFEVPNIGDYVYSDGSWGPLAYYTDKWPQAVVFSNYTSAADRASGYKHGYAMALRDAAWPTPWATQWIVDQNLYYPDAVSPKTFESIAGSATLTMLENIEGLSICTALESAYLHGYVLNFGEYVQESGRWVYYRKQAAIACAMDYGSENWKNNYSSTPNISAFEAPGNTSGWFLPSTGQWFLCFTNLAGLDPNELEIVSSGGSVTGLAWKFNSSSARQTYLDAFSNYFSSYSNQILGQYESSGRMVSTTFYLPYNGQMDWYLWACDEADKEGNACVVLLDSKDIIFTYIDKTSGEGSSNGYAARSILAF